jgi:hypothetical protein
MNAEDREARIGRWGVVLMAVAFALAWAAQYLPVTL